MNLPTQYDIMSQNIQTIRNPLVADMYVKREYSPKNPARCQDVLVIEANFSDKVMDYEAYSEKIAELLIALPSIKYQVEDHVGLIDRVDIKTH